MQTFFFFSFTFNLFNMILQNHKCVPLEDLAAEFKLRTQVLSVHPFDFRSVILPLDAVIYIRFQFDSMDKF